MKSTRISTDTFRLFEVDFIPHVQKMFIHLHIEL